MNDAQPDAVTPTVMRTFPTASNRGDVTVGEVIDAFMAAYTGRDTALAQRLAFWYPSLGTVRLPVLDAELIADHLDQLAGQPVRKYVGMDNSGHRLYREHHQRSGATLNRYLAALSTALQWAIRRRLTPKGWHNPARDVRRAQESAGRVRFLSKDECHRLLSVARISAWSKLFLLILMAVVTGARRGELLGLRYRDLNLPDAEEGSGTATLHSTKNGDMRCLVLTPAVCREIRRHGIGAPDGLLFPGKFRPHQPYSIEEAWRRALRLARIEGFRFHDLRHTCASYLAQSGASLLEVADVLGHRSLAMTKRYAHLTVQSKTRLVQNVLGEIGVTPR